MAAIRIEALQFYYDSPYHCLFEDLSLVLDTDWRTALVGRNGRGKTTLLKLLHGELKAARGSIDLPTRTTRFPFEPEDSSGDVREVVKQCVGRFAHWEAEMETLLEKADEESLAAYSELQQVYDEAGGYTIDARIEKELAGLGIDGEMAGRSFETLSAGEQARALIAVLFLKTGCFPLIDEPTNHLDMDGRELLAEYLRQKDGYLLVSHDRYFLDRCCDHVLSINKGDVRLEHGNFSTWKEQMDLREASERARQENLSREVKGLEAAALRRRGWSALKEKEKRGAFDKGRIGHMAARQMKRAQASERRRDEHLKEKKSLLKNAEKERSIRLRSESGSPDLVATLDRVAVGFGGVALLEDVSLRVERGGRLAILGPNGCGKSTLLRALAGEVSMLAGERYLPGHLNVARGYQVPIWSQGLLREHLRQAEIDEVIFRATMGSLGVHGEIFDRPLETFSMGELKKVDLCRSFLEPRHLLLWDEPMNYIDLESREDIEEVILEQEPTMVFVEHDRAFVETVATAVLDLSEYR